MHDGILNTERRDTNIMLTYLSVVFIVGYISAIGASGVEFGVGLLLRRYFKM